MVTQALTQPHHCVRCRASSRRPARLLWTKAAPPLDRPVTMMVGLREGTDVDDMAGQVKALDAVDDVQVLRSIKMLTVRFNAAKIDATAAHMALSALEGAKFVEQD